MGSCKAKASVPDEGGHLVTIDWKRGKWSGLTGQYSRQHRWHLAGDLVLEVTDAMPPPGYRDGVRLDAWRAYVAAISSGHMLAWLHAAFSHGVEVESYLDRTEGMLSSLPQGRTWVSEVILNPKVTLSAGMQTTAAQIAHFHDLARRDCFIACSVKTKITVASA
jgi:organic hydroperoxide reductase OsmC/OhrA